MTLAGSVDLARVSRSVGLHTVGGGALASILRGTMSIATAYRLAEADAAACPGSDQWAEVTDMVLRSVFPSLDALPEGPLHPAILDESQGPGKLLVGCCGSVSGDELVASIALPGHEPGAVRRRPEDGALRCGVPVRHLQDTEGHTRGPASCCGNPACPICYPRVALDQAERLAVRLDAEVYLRVGEGRNATIRHWEVSVPRSMWWMLRTVEGYKALRSMATERAKLLFPGGGVELVFHPFRQCKGSRKKPAPEWQWGPHWHLLAVGALDCTNATLAEVRRDGWASSPCEPESMRSDKDAKVSERGIVPLNRVRYVSRYVMSHAGVIRRFALGEQGHRRFIKSVTDVGTMASQSKDGLRVVARDKETAYPTVLGEDGVRRFLWDAEGLDAVRESVHGDYDLRAYDCSRRRAAYAHASERDLRARVRMQGLEVFGLVAPPSDWCDEVRAEKRMLAPLAVSECVGRSDVYVATVRDVDGPTVSDLRSWLGVDEPELGDRWDPGGASGAPLSLAERALDSWRGDRRGWLFADVLTLCELEEEERIGQVECDRNVQE